MTPKVQHFIDTQQDFFVVCMLIWFIDFHCPLKKKAEQKERVEKPQILNIRNRIMCVFFNKGFFTFDVMLVRWVGRLNT